MLDVLMHECAKHASEYCQEQAGTTWGQQRESSSQVLPLDSGNLEASGNTSSQRKIMAYPTLPHNIRPLICIHLVPAPSETCWFRGMSVGGSFRRM